MAAKGAIPVPVATKTAGRSEGRKAKCPRGPENAISAPGSREARKGVRAPSGTWRIKSARGASSGPEVSE